MADTASISTGIADRYATAIFELAEEGGTLAGLERDIDSLAAALSDSADLTDLISSPIYTRDEAEAAIGAVAKAMGLSDITGNTLRLMAQKRRLFVVPALIRAVKARLSEHKGEVEAEVISAKALTKTQAEKLAKTLAERVGKDVKLNQIVDDTLIGGLVVKVGSKMIDTSIRSRLNALRNSMKEVG